MIRITGGHFRGRSLHTPPSAETTRPSQARLREAIFSMVQLHIPNATVLDLFAGSGALGFEALSRGACWAGFVDSSSRACASIRKNQTTLGVSACSQVWQKSVDLALPQLLARAPYDCIFADPPYGRFQHLLTDWPWERLLRSSESRLIWESEGDTKKESPALPDTCVLEKVKERFYGRGMITLLTLRETSG